MSFEYGVDGPLVSLGVAQQCIRRLVRPIHIQRGGKRRDEIIKEILARRVVPYQAIPHLRPGQVVDPGRVRSEELRRPRRRPVW